MWNEQCDHIWRYYLVFGQNFFKIYFVFGNNLNLLWQFLTIGQIFTVLNGQIIEQTIWSHWKQERGREKVKNGVWQSEVASSVTSKKLPNVYKSYLKLISLEKLKISTPLQKLPKNVVDLGKLIVAKVLEKLPKVQ